WCWSLVYRVQACLTAQLQHVVFFRLPSAGSDCFRPQNKIGHDRLLCRCGFHRNNHRFTSANSRESGNIQHIRCFDVSDLTKDSHQFREIVETDEAITHPIAAALRLQFQHRGFLRSEEHTSELQSRFDLVCRLLLEKKKNMRT